MTICLQHKTNRKCLLQVFEEPVNFMSSAEFLIKDEKIIESKLRDEIILQHDTCTSEQTVITRYHQ